MTRFYVEVKGINKIITVSSQHFDNQSFNDNKCFISIRTEDISLLIRYFVEKLSEVVNDNNLVVIMSGGKGTRMKPFTRVMPKALFPINNTTVLEKIIFSFINYSFFIFLKGDLYVVHDQLVY